MPSTLSVTVNILKHPDWPKEERQKSPIYYRYHELSKKKDDIVGRGNEMKKILLAREEARAHELKPILKEQQKPYIEEDLEGAIGGTDAQDISETHSESLASRLNALRLTSPSVRGFARN